ncbi:MAG: hypothetical protein ACK5Z5_04885 [Neisseriaceae bacterium]
MYSGKIDNFKTFITHNIFINLIAYLTIAFRYHKTNEIITFDGIGDCLSLILKNVNKDGNLTVEDNDMFIFLRICTHQDIPWQLRYTKTAENIISRMSLVKQFPIYRAFDNIINNMLYAFDKSSFVNIDPIIKFIVNICCGKGAQFNKHIDNSIAIELFILFFHL